MTPDELFPWLWSECPAVLVGGAACLAVSLWMLHRSIDIFRLRRLTIPAVFYYTYLVMIFFPSFWVYANKQDPYRTTYIFAVISLLVTLPLGILATNHLSRFKKAEIEAQFRRPIEEGHPDIHVFFAHVLMVAVALSIAALYVLQVGSTPLQHLISNPGDEENLMMMREQSFKLLDPRWGTSESTQLFYAYLFLRTLLFPFLILTTFGYWLHTRARHWLILFCVTLVAGGLYAASSIARAPLAAIFMRLFFFLYLFKQRLHKSLVLVFAILIVSFPLVITSFAYGRETGLLLGIERIAIRFTYTPAEDLYYYFEIFPDHHDYCYGHTILKPILKLFGGDYFYIENYVHRYISPQAAESGHANAAFLSNLHADFGVMGVLFGGFFTGMLIQAFQVMSCRQKKGIYGVATYSFLVYAVWALDFGSITSVLFVNGMLPVLFLPPFLRGLTTFFRQATGCIRERGKEASLA